MGFDKKGISAIVATVLIILITIAAVTIIWVTIIPMLQENIASTEQFDVDLSIVTTKGYTAWDDETNMTTIQVKRGGDDSNISRIQLIISCKGNSYPFDVPAPLSNQAKTYLVKFNCEPEGISVAPIFSSYSRQGNDIGSISHKIDNLPEGNIVVKAGDNYFDENGISHSVECTSDGDCSGGTPYCVSEGCVTCKVESQTTDCDDSNECTNDACSINYICQNNFVDEGITCSVGVCDGQGNCGECNYATDCVDKKCYDKHCVGMGCVYSLITPCTMFFDDFETGQIWEHDVFEVGGEDSWAIFSSSSGGSIDFSSNWAGVPGQLNDEFESSYIKSPLINLIDATIATLTFNSWTNDEGDCPFYDAEYIEVSIDSGSSWTTISECPEDLLHDSYDMVLRKFVYTLDDYAGQEIKIRFRYDTIDSCCGDEEGWYIDDVNVTILS